MQSHTHRWAIGGLGVFGAWAAEAVARRIFFAENGALDKIFENR